MRFVILIFFSVTLLSCQEQAHVPPDEAGVSERMLEADVRFLADDLLEGREAGTRGYDLAAHYVAQRLRSMGLEPAGENGSYFQEVPLYRSIRRQEGARFSIAYPDRTLELAFQKDYLPGHDFTAEKFLVTAPLVFVSQAVVAPELDQDDLAGLDLRGKIAVVLSNAPSRFDNNQRAFYSSGREKLAALNARGVVGVVWISDPDREAKRPWEQGAANWQRPAMKIRPADGGILDGYANIQAQASLSVAAARKLFVGSKYSADEVFEMLKSDALKSFELPVSVTIAGQNSISTLTSRNVVARLPGTDSLLRNEHVVFSAHLDHVGIGAEVNGDKIYNGALDNALGVSVMLDVARQMSQARANRRSGLFLAVTAEEKGLLGSQYFSEYPTVSADSIVANINMDMPVILTELTDVIALGTQHSSLKDAVEQSAQTVGVSLSEDPFPEEVFFVRSDQYSFIRKGIPALAMDGGIDSASSVEDGKKTMMDFLANHYHQPSDSVALPIHYPSVAKLARLNAEIAWRVANADERPRWNEGDFFGTKFGKAP